MVDGPAPMTPGGKTIQTPGRKPETKVKRSRGRGFLNTVLVLGVIVALGLFGWAEYRRQQVEKRLQQTEQQLQEVQKSTQQSGEEAAKQVLEKVKTLIDIPNDPQPTVATIVDVNKLRETSDFYKKAENGDHLIITKERAILYDPDRGVILDVVPVVLDPNQQQAGGSPAPAGSPAATNPTPTPAP